jgi:hypothetical protein
MVGRWRPSRAVERRDGARGVRAFAVVTSSRGEAQALARFDMAGIVESIEDGDGGVTVGIAEESARDGAEPVSLPHDVYRAFAALAGWVIASRLAVDRPGRMVAWSAVDGGPGKCESLPGLDAVRVDQPIESGDARVEVPIAEKPIGDCAELISPSHHVHQREPLLVNRHGPGGSRGLRCCANGRGMR